MKFNLRRKIKQIIFKNQVKKRTRKQRKTTYRKKVARKPPLIDPNKLSPKEKEGVEFARLVTTLWKLQSKPQKAYVLGYRIHHGLVGTLLSLYGTSEGDDYMKGFGKGLMEDDINDLPKWIELDKKFGEYTGFA